jgi:alkanesulfonate monooxygenase SsuD/methylene tetrahydromethanopterin reductase-like flavin-dependent oxidoreductase (luciferase family)
MLEKAVRILLLDLRQQRDEARKERDEARKERDELWHALQSLTPQGSDDGEPLCGTPEECVAYVRELKRELEKFRRMQDAGMVLDI